MKLLLDTDILLDVALKRVPFFSDSNAVLVWCEDHPGEGFIAWHSLSNVYYILRKEATEHATRGFISETLETLEVIATGTPAAKQALRLGLRDFEDALQVAAASVAGVDYIVTRDVVDYASSPIPALRPTDMLAALT
ncbi:PIN domain-containing protein [soil metagenome]